jgi:hypothetical protein
MIMIKMVRGINLKKFLNLSSYLFFALTFIFFFIFVSKAHAETYKLQCIYEQGGKKIITIDEQNKIVINSPGRSWNYRKKSEYVYVYEVASLQKQTINRYIVDLENLNEEMIIVKVTKKNIEDINMLLPKFERGEIIYDRIDKLKKESFEQWFKDPKTTKNKVVKNWRNDWEGGHPEEYIMYENNSDLFYQLSLIHRCDFIN